MLDVYSKKSTFSPIFIGNNVFIGICSIMMPGTKIGDNSIVAAGSVVKGDFPDDVVIGGNPARVISSLDEYYTKNLPRVLSVTKNRSRREQIIEHVSEL